MRGRKTGSTLRGRFETKWIGEPNSGCWLWTGALTHTDPSLPIYKVRPVIREYRSEGGKWRNAARVSWELHRGAIPDGLFVCHTCDLPLCVNPDHLFLGTRTENMQDMRKKGRSAKYNGQYNGEAATGAKLTAANVLEIRNSSDTGVELSKRFGVGDTQISRIRNGKRWRHVT